MLIDTHGLTRGLEGKTLRIRFTDATEDLLVLEMAMIYDCHEDCNGFIYRVISSTDPARLNRIGSSYFGRFQDIASWEIAEVAE